jgi:DNA-binding response OmpR family regulator
VRGYNKNTRQEGVMATKKKVLIVDDEPNITEVLKMNLEASGEFEVLVENAPANALSAARQFKPDLILLDVMMPGTDGGQVAAQMNADPLLKPIPIVFLTAAVTKDEAEILSDRIGGYPFIAKPVGIEELIASIKKHLR